MLGEVGDKDEGLGDRIGGLGARAGPEVSSLGALPNTCSMYSIISGWNWRTCGICKMCEQYCYIQVRSHKKHAYLPEAIHKAGI